MYKTSFKSTPQCEACGNEPATAFTYFQRGSHPDLAGWHFTGDCTSDNDDYAIEFERFFASPFSTVDWLAQLHEKTWMNWPDFMEMMTRFREVTAGRR